VDESERRQEVERVLNEIVDPCSTAFGVPIGLVDMGIVDSVDVRGEAISVRLLPTFPGCLYTAVFAGEILRRLDALDWSGEIGVELTTEPSIWDEGRMSLAARERLRKARDKRRRRAQALKR
jgi:metal-sulfur cluster biosynthetic enzyme